MVLTLIVNADDYGYTPERDDGILETFTEGMVSSASLMVNMQSRAVLTESVKKAQDAGLPLGLHLNLSEGVGVASLGRCSLHVAGRMRGKHGLREALVQGLIDLEDVKSEVLCQISLFREITGYTPHHLDGHQHVHVLPTIANYIADAMVQAGIKNTRMPCDPSPRLEAILPAESIEFLESVHSDAQSASEVYKSHGIRFPEFIGLSLMSRQLSPQRILRALDSLLNRGQSLIVELMCHPGNASVSGGDDFARSTDREWEKTVLKDPALLDELERREVTITSYSHCNWDMALQ